MTAHDVYQKYHRLQRKIEKDIENTMDSQRHKKLLALQLRCFPSKEQVIEWIEAFYKEAEG